MHDATLTNLQQVDDAIAKNERRLDDIAERLEGDDAVVAAREALDVSTAELERLERDQRRLDGEAADLASKLASEEQRLYSGEVKATKELTGIQQEVDGLRRRKNAIDERLLGVMEALEAATDQRDEAAARLREEERRWEAESASLREEAERLRQENVRLAADRDAHRGALPRDVIAVYDHVRSRKGAAVARLRGAVCSACGVAVPDAVRKNVMSARTVERCPSCERLLIFGT